MGRSKEFHHAAIVCYDILPSELLLLVRSLIVRIIGLQKCPHFISVLCMYVLFSDMIKGRTRTVDQEIPDMECHYRVSCKGSI